MVDGQSVRMVREISSSESDNTSSSTEFSSNSDSEHTTDSYQDKNEKSSSQDWSEYCRCQTDYRGELNEKYCPACTKVVNEDDNDSSVDWSMIERHFKITKKYSASVENLLRESALFFSEIDPNQKSRDKVRDNNDEDKSDREYVDDLIDESYQADSEDNAE